MAFEALDNYHKNGRPYWVSINVTQGAGNVVFTEEASSKPMGHEVVVPLAISNLEPIFL